MRSRVGSVNAGHLLDPLELIWADIDALFADFSEADWARVHGPDWTFDDIPFHLAYFDRELIARPLVAGEGPDAPTDRVFRTLGDLNEWNDGFFDSKRADQTMERSLADMHSARDEIRAALSSGRTADAPVFVSLPGAGWVDAAGAVKRVRTHTWNHFAEARVRHGRPAPVPDEAIIHDAISVNLGYRPLFCVADESTPPFAARVSIGGHGGGDWVIRILDGTCEVIEEASGTVDLTMAYEDVDAFAAMNFAVITPPDLIESGRLRVSDMAAMARLGELIPPPGPDTVFRT